MALYDLTEFLRLSSALNYNLSAASSDRYTVLMFLTGGRPLHPDETIALDHKAIVMEALSFLYRAYGDKRRRLGPLAVLHPLRAAALLARTVNEINLLDLLTQLFHDILEDIRPTNFETQKWKDMEWQLYSLLDRLGDSQEWKLMRRLVCLTRFENETYYQYIGRLLSDSCCSPELVQVKLADRLDNTLDMRIVLEDPLEGIDFFKNIFQSLFVTTYRGYVPNMIHPSNAALNGAKRLYQLFKNTVLLSLIRQRQADAEDSASRIFFNAVSEASLKEAQRNFIHLVSYHYRDTAQQRQLLLETMQYCNSGRIDLVTKPDPDQDRLLDGLFSTYFDHPSKKTRNQKLDKLYQDKPLMIQASIAFIVIFLCFLNDPTFYVRGISDKGMDPK